MFIRSPYNYDKVAASDETGLSCPEESLTVQDEAEDVNDIMRKFGITGKLPTNLRMPLSGDFTNVGTYQEALQAIREAQNQFMMLPAAIREHFRHDPQRFMEFIEDEKNAQEGEKLGIWKLRRASDEAKAVPAAEPVATKVEQTKVQ